MTDKYPAKLSTQSTWGRNNYIVFQFIVNTTKLVLRALTLK